MDVHVRKTWTFPGNIKSTTINAIVSLSLDPASADSDFPQVKYHKDQANHKDYSHTGPGFAFKKWQADKVSGIMDSEDVQAFKAAFAKMTVLGHDINSLVDCSDVVPTPPPANSAAHFPAGLSNADIEQACATAAFPILPADPGPVTTVAPVYVLFLGMR